MGRLLLLALLALALAPASASAHAVVSKDSGRISWRSADPDSPSTLTVRVQGDRIRFTDPTEHGGMSTTGGCDPGAVDAQGFIREVSCPKAGVSEVFVDLDGGDDKATIDVPVAVTASGRLGNDTITTAAADDTLYGGEGNDTLDPGAGSDVAQGEAGDDQLKLRDGTGDTAACGDGVDVAETDTQDAVPPEAGCETVNGAPVSGPGGGPAPSPAGDQLPPRVEVPGSRSVRARGGRFTVRVGVDEAARLTLSGTVRVGGRTLRIASRRGSATTPGVRRMAIRLSARARAALRRSGRATARLSIVARDAAGNAGRLKVTLRLRV